MQTINNQTIIWSTKCDDDFFLKISFILYISQDVTATALYTTRLQKWHLRTLPLHFFNSADFFSEMFGICAEPHHPDHVITYNIDPLLDKKYQSIFIFHLIIIVNIIHMLIKYYRKW